LDNERQKALDTVIKNMEKSFGKGAVMKLGDNKGRRVSSTSSGSVTVDNALGVGGYPKGRIIEIYGPESSGKTTVALHAIAEVQKNGGVAAFIDAEHALDPVYAQALGVDIDNLYLSQPDQCCHRLAGWRASRNQLENAANHCSLYPIRPFTGSAIFSPTNHSQPQ